jgi:serpin B
VITTKQGVSQAPKNIPKSHNAFGFDLIKSIKKDEPGKNIFISPSSVALALSMVYNGANGETKNAMQKTLHLQGLDISNINQESLGLINLLKNPDPKVQLSIANSVWARKEVNFNQNFIATLKSYYNAESSVLDFTNPNSVKTINSWVSKKTNGKIPAIVNQIPSDMVMYLINAVYFKGSWTKEFDKRLTQSKPFTVADGSSKSTLLMKQGGMLPYLENDEFQSVNLTYGNNNRVSMYVFLPKSNVDNFVSSLTPEKWNGWMSEYKNKSGVILLPKFKMDYEKQLKDILAGLGMRIAFSDNADLSGIGKDLKISEVKHKSYVDVNEEGTEAAAVTSVGVSITSAAPPQDTFYMEVNHPFFFAIRDNQTEEVLFMGIVQNP